MVVRIELTPVCVFHCRWPAICIHGDKAQQEREWVLQGELKLDT